MAESKTTLISQISERVHARIIKNDLAPGTILGTEQDLADTYGVGYNTMREALGRLRALGIVTGKQRKGVIVREPRPFAALTSILPLIAKEREDLKSLHDFRAAIELGAVHWAVLRATQEQVDEMEATLEPFERLHQNGPSKESLAYDSRYHELLLEMSGNKLLCSLHGVINDYFGIVLRKKPVKQVPTGRAKDHRDLFEAIREKDVDQASKVLWRHFTQDGVADSLSLTSREE